MEYITDIEEEFVRTTYNKIYTEFSNTRGYLWEGVRTFLDNILTGSTIVEIGSGNGKNLLRRKDCYPIAFDIASAFTSITNSRGIDSILGNSIMIPVRSNSVDYVLNIAVLHHLSTYERRIYALKELFRILKPNGKIIIQVWASKQPSNSRRQFTQSDEMVPWYNRAKTKKEVRYYHIFQDNELKDMLLSIENIRIDQYYWEFGNWIAICTKL